MSGLEKKPTQTERIMKHLREHGTITAYEAMREYGIMQLAARLCELERAGVQFERRTAKGKNRYGEPMNWTVYSLKEAE
ncbi:MAG: helix-turn-helix domain-containing protein [Clostridia bacterium]|nr:helix-turn-helix domain-containing protein [Clostridia bacterium]